MADLKQLAEAIINGNAPQAKELTQQALDAKTPVKQIVNDGLIAGMAILEPLLVKSGVKPLATVVIGTVKGDLHDIGKNLVAMMLTGGGLKVVDLSIDVSPEKFVEGAKSSGAQIIAMSALLTTTMPQMAEVVKAVKASGIKAKTMIGGAPVTQSYADEIKADGYAPDAASAVDVAKKLIQAA